MSKSNFLSKALWVILFAVLGATTALQGTNAQANVPHSTMSIYFFDVDQGDATLFKSHDVTILIDAGRHDRSDVVPLLRSVGVESIDLFIGTHPHADHIGQCEPVMKNFDVREVWLSGDVHTSRTFERCIDAILASDAGYHEPRAGEVFQFGPVRLEVIHPGQLTGNLNDGSVGVRVVYGDVIVLMTGDAESAGEREMLRRNVPLAANILHLGHHGSSTSSTLPFLQAVEPDLAIYSAGRDNSYGHPHREVVQRVSSLGIPLYGTDTHGTVQIVTNGKAYEVYTDYAVASPHLTHEIPDMCSPGQVNVNAASQEELVRIIHIGTVTAGRIISERPFLDLTDLTRVSGLGAKRVEDIQAQGLACIGAL